ncbi:MAG: HD-GYP domain-containing protein [Firmicutes bacterium]|nr:HD-GYP domain-containing protein [Bacillota bacterium]
MRLLPTNIIEPGMRLARSVVDGDGRLVLASGTTLRQRYIDLLLEQGYTSLYIADDIIQVELSEPVTLETRQYTMSCIVDFVETGVLGADGGFIRKSFAGVKEASAGLRPAVKPGKRLRPDVAAIVAKAAGMLVNEVMARKEVIIGLIDVKSLHDYTFAHSVQVALLAMVAGRMIHYNRQQLLELGVGALLHDVGKVQVPDHIWYRNGGLSPDELAVVQSHPEIGYEYMRKARIGLLSAHIALQHHERWDGSGYPRGLKGEEVHKYARLCAVCDVFDAMTSDRAHKAAVHPYEVLAFLADNAGTLFDPKAVSALQAVVAPYPVATSVILSTGEVAVVKRINNHALERPVVVVTKDPQWNFYAKYRELDLSKEPDMEITGHISWYDDAPRESPARAPAPDLGDEPAEETEG